MKEPRRWLENGAELSELERRVLDAGARVQPPQGEKDALRASIAAAGGPPPAGVDPTGGAAAPLAAGPTIGAVVVLKSALVGLGLGAAASAGWLVLGNDEPSSGATSPPVVAAAATPLEVVPLEQPRMPMPRLEASAAPPVAAPAMRALPGAPAASEPVAPSTPSRAALPDVEPPASGAARAAAESRRVAEARSRLRAGDARGALELLARVAADFPNGVLVQEREALAIQALSAAGDKDGARARALSFLERYPESPHAALAREAL